MCKNCEKIAKHMWGIKVKKKIIHTLDVVLIFENLKIIFEMKYFRRYTSFFSLNHSTVVTNCIPPVSYTHLDVYKRQGLHCPVEVVSSNVAVCTVVGSCGL